MSNSVRMLVRLSEYQVSASAFVLGAQRGRIPAGDRSVQTIPPRPADADLAPHHPNHPKVPVRVCVLVCDRDLCTSVT